MSKEQKPPKNEQTKTATLGFNSATLSVLSLALLEKFDDLIEHFGLDLRQDSFMYFGTCPIHNGNNATAFNLYKDGDTSPGYWCCWTKHCERKYKATPIGFVRGMLSKENPQISFKETIDWICDFVGQSINNIKIDENQAEQRGFVSTARKLSKETSNNTKGVPRLDVRSRLEIPARFFLERQFSPEVLDRFDVGYCADLSKPMGGRVVVPVYDDSRLQMVACSGRTIYSKCLKCGYFHNGTPCPFKDAYRNIKFCKWRHSGQINSYLYNYWNARPYIKKTQTVVVVEGPSDVWRLVEFGVENVVALTGNTLSDRQQIIIEMSGAANVVDLLDNDPAGQEGSKQLEEKLGLYTRIVKPVYSSKDAGDLTKNQFEQEILPTIEKLRK